MRDGQLGGGDRARSPPACTAIKRRARAGRDRRTRLLARDQRGLLRDVAADARRDRHQQHRQLLARLPLADLVRAAQGRSASPARPARSTTSTRPTPRSSSAPTRPRATRSSARGSSRRRCAGLQLVDDRPAPDRARRLRRAAPRAAAGHERGRAARARARARCATACSTTAFIAERTEGYEELEGCSQHYTPRAVEEITGIPAADLERAAHIYGEAPRRRSSGAWA